MTQPSFPWLEFTLYIATHAIVILESFSPNLYVMQYFNQPQGKVSRFKCIKSEFCTSALNERINGRL